MVKRFLFLLTLSFACIGHTAPYDHENLQIEKVDIQLATGSNDGSLSVQSAVKMNTKEGNFFSQTEFDQDLKTLSGEYDRIDPYFSVEGGKLRILLKVWPHPTIRSLCYDGNQKIATKKLQNELQIMPCAPFDRCKFNEAFHRLKAYYIKKGYYDAELDYVVTYDECTNEVDVRIVISEGLPGWIDTIKFCGFTKCEELDLRTKMVTRPYILLLSWLTEQGSYREEMIRHDQYQIQQYLQNKGYADADVSISVEEGCGNKINILITAEKGELYTVDKITFNGNCIFDDDTIFSQFTFCPGDPYSPEKIRNTISALQELYGKRGYIDAFINFKPNLECDCSYSVDVEIDEGDQYCVGLIKVIGNCTTMTNVILHETLLTPGEVFNIQKLKRTEERLRNIGYFKCVNVFAVKSEESCLEGNYRDVHIEVEETGTGKISFFSGFSTSEKLFGGLSISESNFNIAGIPTAWASGGRTLRGGGEYASLSAQYGVKSTNYNLSWTKPYFRDTKWSIGFDLDQNSNTLLDNNVDIDAFGGTLRAGRQLNSFVRFQWHWRARHSSVYYSKQKDEENNDIPPPDLSNNPQLDTITKNDGTVSASGIALSYDSTNSIACPTKGFRSIFEVELAGIGGQYDFWSFSYLNTWYYPFTETIVLKYRADLRFITPFSGTTYDTMPLDERLFLGGNTFVRGYRPYKIGPRFWATRKVKIDDQIVDIYGPTDIPSGGLSQQFLSIELNKKLNEKVDGFLFMDLGHLSQDIWNLDWDYFRGSVGFGVRTCIIPSLPPISFGWGFPLKRVEDRSEVKNFFIQFGCKF